MEKLYIIVRNDISPGLQIAQSCHALSTFAQEHEQKYRQWEGNLVVLQVANEALLEDLEATLRWDHYELSRFEEPDLGGELTAIAVAGDAERELSCLPLALRAA